MYPYKNKVQTLQLSVKKINDLLRLVKTTCFRMFMPFLYLCLHFLGVCLHCWASSADSVPQSARCSRISVERTNKYKQYIQYIDELNVNMVVEMREYD